MFVVAVLFEVASDHTQAFHARVAQQAADSLAKEPGCHRFDVAIDPERPEYVFLYELYDDAAAFDVHLASAHFADFSAATGSMTVSKRVETFQLAH